MLWVSTRSRTGMDSVKQLEWVRVLACVCVCVGCNTVAVYQRLSSKQLVPICFFFSSCGLRLRQRGALACGVWVSTNSGEVCAAGVCVCVWMWFMASECSCVYMWFRTWIVYVCVCGAGGLMGVWIMHVCVHLARAAFCMPVWCDSVCVCVCVCVCVREFVWWLAIITLYFHFNIDSQSCVAANISRSALLPSYCLRKLSHDAVCCRGDSLRRRGVQSFHSLFM